jgi:AraC-like DNA-binding protein
MARTTGLGAAGNSGRPHRSLNTARKAVTHMVSVDKHDRSGDLRMPLATCYLPPCRPLMRFVLGYVVRRRRTAALSADPGAAQPLSVDCAAHLYSTLTVVHQSTESRRRGDPASCELLVAGPRSQHVVAELEPAQETTTVIFKPGCLGALWQLDAPALVDRTIAVRDLPAHCDLHRLTGHLTKPASVARVLFEVEVALQLRVGEDPAQTRRLSFAYLVDQASRDATVLRSHQLSELAGMTVRTFQRQCIDVFGIAPKRLLRIARLQRALRLLRSRPHAGTSLAGVARHSGFADTSHMAREFCDLAGCEPGAVFRTLQQSSVCHLTYGAPLEWPDPLDDLEGVVAL